MPLDLKKVIFQLKNSSENHLSDVNQRMIDSTYTLFQTAKENKEKLMTRLLETQSSKGAKFFFAIPDLDEAGDSDLGKLVDAYNNFSLPHITIATDGSQINPSAHEFTNASLINIGLIAIPYFEGNIPVLLTSEPTFYSSPEDINFIDPIERIEEEDLIAYERTLQEVEGLVKIAKMYESYKLPIVALLDGTLIYWHLEKFSNTFIEHFIKRFSNAMLELKSLGIPVASFLSNSRSNDLINMLRIYKCPYELVNCKHYCSNNNSSRNLPCNPILDYKPILDRRLIMKYFQEKGANIGARTILFKSNSKILNYYPEDVKIFFFYMMLGNEVARVELPLYTAKNDKLLSLLHNAIVLQCKAGFGYPITLSEAHLQAVVTKANREIFYNLLKEHILQKTSMPVKLSNKELKKRISFV